MTINHSVCIQPGGASEALAGYLKTNKSKRIFLVTGKTSYTTSGAEAALASVFKSFTVERFSDASSNPTLETIVVGSEQCVAFNPDVILAIGGGSVIDTAKGIAAVAGKPDQAEGIVNGSESLESVAAPIIAMPTTAGSGSEATHFAVIYVAGEKFSLTHSQLLPALAVLDVKFVESLPADLFSPPAFDALFQAIESMWALQATSESQQFASRAIKMIRPSIISAIQGNAEARAQMLEAAYWAGRAIDISRTTAAHAFAYSLTVHCGVPHGHAVAVMFLPVLRLTTKEQVWRTKPALTRQLEKLFSLFGVIDGVELESLLRGLLVSAGAPTVVGDVGCSVDIESLLSEVNEQRLSNHPISIDRDDLLRLLDS